MDCDSHVTLLQLLKFTVHYGVVISKNTTHYNKLRTLCFITMLLLTKSCKTNWSGVNEPEKLRLLLRFATTCTIKVTEPFCRYATSNMFSEQTNWWQTKKSRMKAYDRLPIITVKAICFNMTYFFQNGLFGGKPKKCLHNF